MQRNDEPLYKRLGMRQDDIREKLFIQLYDIARSSPPDALGNDAYKMGLIDDQSEAAFRCYLAGDLSESVARARDAVQLALDYFFGVWRSETLDRNGQRYPEEHWQSVPWVEQYRWALFWATGLGDWKACRQLSRYPSGKTTDYISERKSEAPWYLRLAAFVRGEGEARLQPIEEPASDTSLAKEGSYEESIERGRSKRLKLLNAVLTSMQNGNASGVQERIGEYLAYYLKKEFPRDVIDDKLSIDGSILLRLAEHRGIKVEFSDRISDHILQFPFSGHVIK